MYWFRHLQLRWKLLIMVMPLVLVPLLLIAFFVSNVSMELAYEGITRATRDDFQHMSDFSLDLIDGHYRQYEVYQQEREEAVRRKLRDIVDLAYNLVETQYEQSIRRELPSQGAKIAAKNGLKFASIGEGGYITVMDSGGKLLVHPVSEGKNIFDSKDEAGRYFIKEMCDSAVKAPPGEVLFTAYSWKNALLGDTRPREKVVAYRFFSEWGWVISAGNYLDEIYDEQPFKNRAFDDLKKKLKEKKVGKSGFIYAADCSGRLAIHPHYEGQSVNFWLDGEGQEMLHRLCEKKQTSGWMRSLQEQEPDKKPRVRIAKLEYFPPWDWVVFVEAYEDELFGRAAATKKHIMASVIFFSLLVSGVAGLITFYVAKRFTFPIFMMTEEIARAGGSRLVRKITVPEAEELKKLAIAINTMSDLIQRDKVLEEKLAKMEKMASIGVLSSGVAHEINNPMGVILGYACHLEKKLDENDPNFHFIQEIKQESKRCVKIVQNLLDFARAPKLSFEQVDINDLLDQIVDFARSHAETENISLQKNFSDGLPEISIDADQLRQVMMNLILNGAAAMKEGGTLTISTFLDSEMLQIVTEDTGQGIPRENLNEVYEPFFTTKAKGTGLGLAISKQIVEAHLGTIEIESTVGVGTTVIMRLPVK
ncbi:sensor histidine kinase [Desulfopila inferna]|uniref:sensor histidine kinase n=1 Tax=Desulfopila inferna TaxID=468528 RepID=UPI0019634CED|nr:cache domain-containing protein [Desulfopila inferna]MBM9604809.1 cache domain-containing protein [Desulfopila inferna]